MVNGRGAWNVSGVGGTKQYNDSSRPGPYYFDGSGVDINEDDPNQYAVRGAVKAYQRALTRRLGINLKIDGAYKDKTHAAVLRFQDEHPAIGLAWGGIGPDTSKALLLPDLKRAYKRRAIAELPLAVLSGTIRHESNWDAGAVGYVDPRDVGLAQINAEAHPEWDTDTRLEPINAFNFVIQYYNGNIPYFKGNIRDAIASYNLGRGGTNSWIRDGRPDVWTPDGSTTPRDVKQYIDSILQG